MDNAKLLEMNRWLSVLAAHVISTHVPGSTGAGKVRERHEDELHSHRSPPPTAVRTGSWSRVEPFICTLPKVQQEVLRLHLAEGLTYWEVAERLAVPLGTVHSRVARAKRRIRAAASQRTPPADGLPPLVRRCSPGTLRLPAASAYRPGLRQNPAP